MRMLARMGYTLVGLALIAPSAARAGMPVDASTPWMPRQTASKPGLFKASAAKATQKRVGERLCADCNRVRVMAAEGVAIAPPPPLPPGMVVRGEMCTQCGRPAAVLAGRLPSRNMPGQGPEAGRAVVDDSPMFVGNGIDPAPIGTFQPRLAAAVPPIGPRGTLDASVMPTSVASDPVAPMVHNRPHVLSHLLGVSAWGRDRADAKERKKEEQHAMIPYGPQGQPTVTEVPASLVYGKRR